MFSFMKITTFAVLAFGALASAIPAPAAEAGALVARGKDVTSILTQLNIDLKEPCNELSILTSATATSVNVNVSVVKIKVLLQSATAACGQSSGLGSGNILGLLSICMKLVLSACSHCFSVCTDKSSVLAVLQILDGVLASLTSTVCSLVFGILSVVTGILTGLLGSAVQSITSLHFTSCEKVLFIL